MFALTVVLGLVGALIAFQLFNIAYALEQIRDSLEIIQMNVGELTELVDSDVSTLVRERKNEP